MTGLESTGSMSREQARAIAASVAQEARETFPEYFTGKTDWEILNEIVATVRRAGVKV